MFSQREFFFHTADRIGQPISFMDSLITSPSPPIDSSSAHPTLIHLGYYSAMEKSETNVLPFNVRKVIPFGTLQGWTMPVTHIEIGQKRQYRLTPYKGHGLVLTVDISLDSSNLLTIARVSDPPPFAEAISFLAEV